MCYSIAVIGVALYVLFPGTLESPPTHDMSHRYLSIKTQAYFNDCNSSHPFSFYCQRSIGSRDGLRTDR